MEVVEPFGMALVDSPGLAGVEKTSVGRTMAL